MALPPTSSNLLQHVLRAHLQIILWKAADQHSPPEESVDITRFGWEFKDGIPIPVIDHSDPAPSELIDIIKCQCKAQGKMCSSEVCGCHKKRISCTSYCYCSSKKGCCNPFTKREDSLVRRDEGSTESEEQNDPDEQDLDGNTDDDEDIEDEPTESYFMDDEWQ